MHQRDQEAVAAEQHALVRLALEHALVGHEELQRETERDLCGVQRFAGQRMRGACELRFELRPQCVGRVPVPLGKLEPARVAHGDEIGRGERIADETGRLDRIALQRGVEPCENLRWAGFRRVGRLGIDGGKAERE